MCSSHTNGDTTCEIKEACNFVPSCTCRYIHARPEVFLGGLVGGWADPEAVYNSCLTVKLYLHILNFEHAAGGAVG